MDRKFKFDEPHAPGQFPEDNDDDDDEEKETWLSFLAQSIPFFSSWTWEGWSHDNHNPKNQSHRHHNKHGSQSEGQPTDSDFPFIESEVEIETTPDEDGQGSAREDYFSYPTHRSGRKRNWHPSTPLSHPFSRNRKNKMQRIQDAQNSKDPPSRDDTWNLISASETPIASADNGAPELHPSAPNSQSLSKTLAELDEVEINTFLQNFGRHTREVRLFGNTQHFSRMPQWSDFAYSSDEDDEKPEDNPQQAAIIRSDPHKRSKLLMHIDRGLQQLQPEGLPNAVPEQSPATVTTTERVQQSSPYCSLLGDCNIPDTTVQRTSNVEVLHEKYSLPPDESSSPLQGITEETSTEPVTTTAVYSTNDDTDAYESAANSVSDIKRRKHSRSDRAVRDDHVDGVAFCIAYILAFIEHYAPNDLDEAPITEYRESRARSHLERLYIIAPFWEQLFRYLQALYCWENPRRTAAAAMIYFVLWYTDLIPTAFFLMLLYHVLQFRYMPPDESFLHRKVQQRMQRGMDANRLSERLKRRSRLDILDIYKRWQASYGVPSQVMVGDFADYHEKVKNILLWRNPTASKGTVVLLSLSTAFITFCSAHTVFKTILFMVGFTFFCLMPLQAHYPRYRRPLNPLWWLVLGSPTDAQYAVQILRQRHQRHQKWLQEHHPEQAISSDFTMPMPDLPTTPSHVHEMRREDTVEAQPPEKKPLSNKRVGSFLCQHHGMPGHLIITPTHLYFNPLHIVGSGKHHLTRLSDIIGLRKTHSLRLWLWSSNGLKISLKNRSTLQFHNMTHRDDAFNLLLTFGSEVWHKV